MESQFPASRPSLAELFGAFFRLGLTAFGGPSMVAYIRKLSVEQKHWLDRETFNHGVALCQAIPGATAIQTTAFVGLIAGGVPGAAACFIGFGLPAFLIMVAFAAVYTYTSNLPAIVAAFSGLQAIIVAIVANAAISFGKTSLTSWKRLLIAGVAALLFALNLNPALIILLAALGGFLLLSAEPPAGGKPLAPFPVQPTGRAVIGILLAAALGFGLLFVFQRNRFELAALFFRIDLLAFGGGFSSLPLMYREVVDVRGWMDSATFLNGIALGQVTPGPIVITATFVGYILHGLWGAILATIGIFLPSFTLVVGITPYFNRLRSFASFNKVIAGVLCSFVGLLVAVTLRFAGDVHWSVVHLLLASAALLALLRKVDILWVVLAGIALSVILIR